MKYYNTKQEVFKAITTFMDFGKIIITGSTALKLWGFTEESNPLDLDLVIYDIQPSSWDKLKALHTLLGSSDIIYEIDSETRNEGSLVSLSFPKSPTENISVHLFCMDSKKVKPSYFNVDVEGVGKCYLNHPMNIIKAKKGHGREKDFKQLFAIAANIVNPLYPELKDAEDSAL